MRRQLSQSLAKHKPFIGNVAAMMSGKSAAAAIALVTMPIVARLFSPSDFGIGAAFLAVVSIVSNPASLRYEMALVLPDSQQEATTLMALAYWILLAVCGCMLALLGLYEMAGLRWASLEILGVWMWLLPLGVFLMAAVQIQEQWLARTVSFKLIAVSTVLGTVINAGTRIGLGLYAGSSAFGLIISNILGTFGRLVFQKSASAKGAGALLGHLDSASMREVARRYADFPRLNAPAGLVTALGQNLPVLLFGVMFSPAAAGFYSMANRLSQVPTTVVANSMRRVFLQKAASIHSRGGSLRKSFLLTTCCLALAGALPFGCLWLFGQPLLGWLLGARWYDAGRYLEIMAPWLLMLWVTAPSNPVFIVLRKQKLWLALQLWLTALRLGAFGLAYALSAGPEWTLQAFVIVTIAANLFMIGFAWNLISKFQANSP